jgi:YVTN family beta-propeller protein
MLSDSIKANGIAEPAKAQYASLAPPLAPPLLAVCLAIAGLPTQSLAQPTSAAPYSIYVASEAGDIVSRIEVGPDGWSKAGEVSVKLVPNEISGPHNVAVSPDGKFWYVSIAHGTPNGSVWKFDADSDKLVSRVDVGMFPTTIALSPDGTWAYVPNSDFHGDRGKQNTVSAFYTPTMAAMTEIPVCDMPHGARWNRSGSVVYLACMMSDELVALDAGAFAVRSRVALGSGKPMTMAEHLRAEARQDSAAAHAAHARKPGAASSTQPGQDPDCLATFVSVSPDDRSVYIACSHSGELQVRNAATLELVKRVPVGAGAYNVEPSPDGKLVLVTNKKAQSVSVVNASSLVEVARIETSKKLPHGIAFSPDGRYAFISCESVGTDPGAVDAIDLQTMKRVASLDIPLQPTGIAVRK